MQAYNHYKCKYFSLLSDWLIWNLLNQSKRLKKQFPISVLFSSDYNFKEVEVLIIDVHHFSIELFLPPGNAMVSKRRLT